MVTEQLSLELQIYVIRLNMFECFSTVLSEVRDKKVTNELIKMETYVRKNK